MRMPSPSQSPVTVPSQLRSPRAMRASITAMRARRSVPTSCAAIAMLLASTFALVADRAEASPPPRATLNGSFHEAVQEEVAVSGSVVVGVAAASALSGEAALAGLMVPASADAICLTLLSRDGVYFSRNSYDVRAGAGGMVVLPYDDFTRERDRIRRYAAGDLAVRAMPGGCDDSPAIYLVPTSGNPADTVDVLVNAFGANDVYFRGPDGAETDCEEFTEGRRTSYDYRCRIPLGQLGAGRKQVVIERERYGRPLGAVTIELQLGAGP
jgi:hypothetical protein